MSERNLYVSFVYKQQLRTTDLNSCPGCIFTSNYKSVQNDYMNVIVTQLCTPAVSRFYITLTTKRNLFYL